MRNVGPCLSLIAALLCAAPVRAADPGLPAIDPPGQGRVMTHDDSTTTSKCVGNPITPLCAVETIIACFERKDGELCRIGMNVEGKPYFMHAQPQPRPYRFQRYRILSSQHVDAISLLPPWFIKKHGQYQPGDVQIVVLEQACQRNPERCDPVNSSDRFTYVVRRADSRWFVINWWTPDPRFETISPEKF